MLRPLTQQGIREAVKYIPECKTSWNILQKLNLDIKFPHIPSHDLSRKLSFGILYLDGDVWETFVIDRKGAEELWQKKMTML